MLPTVGYSSHGTVIGEIRSFGPDYTTKTRLTPPVLVGDVALAVAACVTGKLEPAESVRSAGMTTYDQVKESDKERVEDVMRHVDGADAIVEFAQRAKAARMSL